MSRVCRDIAETIGNLANLQIHRSATAEGI
jgi:hypothetical protein